MSFVPEPGEEALPLSDLERDGIAELLNISMGRATAALESLVGEPVTLTVPTVSFISLPEAQALVDQETDGDACAIRQSFAGGFDGEAFLVFPNEGARRLAAHILGDDEVPPEPTEDEIDALKEIGNVVMNTCLTTLVEILKSDGVDCTLPHILRGEGRAVLKGELAIGGEHSVILFKRVRFTLESINLAGYVLLGLGLQSARHFKDTVSQNLTDLGG
ncbi:MAG: chemotaxis protein CheX [Rhodospirillaceae bacterium]